jgi:TadE-like protein
MKSKARSQVAKTGARRTVRGGDRGATLLEFALAISTFLVVLLAVLEMGVMIYSYAVISAAAREGVRYAGVVGINNNDTAGKWTLNEVPGNCPFGTTPFGSNGDPTVAIQCKVWDYARYSIQDMSGTKLGVTVSFPTDSNPPCQAAAATPWTVPCLVRVAVNYTYAPLFGIPLTPTMSAVAEGRMVN